MKWWFVLMMLMCTPAVAAVYKWTDENGRVQYSDQPRGQAVVVDVPGASASASGGASSVEQQLQKFRLMEQQDQFDRLRAGSAQISQPSQQTARADELRAKWCRQDKINLDYHKDERRRGCTPDRCEWHDGRIRYYETQIKLDCK